MGIFVDAPEEMGGHVVIKQQPPLYMGLETFDCLVSRPSTRKNNHCNWMGIYEINLKGVRTTEI